MPIVNLTDDDGNKLIDDGSEFLVTEVGAEPPVDDDTVLMPMGCM